MNQKSKTKFKDNILHNLINDLVSAYINIRNKKCCGFSCEQLKALEIILKAFRSSKNKLDRSKIKK